MHSMLGQLQFYNNKVGLNVQTTFLELCLFDYFMALVAKNSNTVFTTLPTLFLCLI